MFIKSIKSIVQNVNINKAFIYTVVKLNNKIFGMRACYVDK